jgi:hypothetical protein
MTQLVQSLLERLAQLPEPVQDRLTTRFLQELEEAETQIDQQPRKRRRPFDSGGSRRHGLRSRTEPRIPLLERRFPVAV